MLRCRAWFSSPRSVCARPPASLDGHLTVERHVVHPRTLRSAVVLALAEVAGEDVVLCRELPGAGGCLLLADQDRGSELAPGCRHAAGVEVAQGAVSGG